MNEIGFRRAYSMAEKEIIMRFRGAVPRVWLTIGVLSAVGFISSTVFAQTTSKPIASTAVQRGKDTFQQSCAVCHGKRGNGNGPAASALTTRPSDLTTFAKRKGTFPAAQIEAMIKGSDPVVAHGIPGMMIWGALFSADANGNQAQADARVSDIVKFIESIQVK